MYTCFYSTLLTKLASCSDEFPKELSSLYLDDFVKRFFNDDEISCSKKVSKYLFKNNDKKKSLAQCKKSPYSVFYLKNKPFLNYRDDSTIFEKIKKQLIKAADLLEKETDLIALTNMDFNCKEWRTHISKSSKFQDLIDGEKNNIGEFRKYISKIKEKVVYLNDNDEHTIDLRNSYNKISETVRSSFDFLDFFQSFKSRDRILAFVSSAGTINICFVKESFRTVELSNKVYNPDSQNDLIEKTIDCSEQICSITNKIPKFFSFLNLNRILGFKMSNPVYDNPSTLFDIQNSITQSNKINNKSNSYKAIYLKVLCNDDRMGTANHAPMIFYDYLSLLIAFQHRYDQYSIWKYMNRNKYFKDEMKKCIVDYAQRTTEHLYYDDSLVLLSVIDQETNSRLLTQYNQNLIQKLPKASHQVRIYSFWKFLYACSALTYGSSSLCINNIMSTHVMDVVNKTRIKPFLNHKLINLAYIYTKIDSLANHTTFNAKRDSQNIVDGIFENIGLIRIEEYLKHNTDINWKAGELINTQTYHRYGLIFSVASLLITIISFGMIAYIRIDCERDGKNLEELLTRIFSYAKSPKVLLVVLVILIPIIVWFLKNVFDCIYIAIYSRNIPKLCHFTRRYATKKQKAKQKAK